jgi:chromosome segregation ATPase
MHLRNQELQSQLNAATADTSRLAAENTRLVAQTTSLTTAIETVKARNTELATAVAESKGKHEAEMSALRRSQAGLQRDRSDLQRHVDELKQELSKRPVAFADNLEEQMEGDDLDEREESITPITQSPARSPQLSPIKNTPSRNAPLELETTKSSLQHAHRMVTNLRNNLHREKTEKLELKRLLATAQDEVEQLRNKGSGSKRAGKKPQLRRLVHLIFRCRHKCTI